MTQPLTTFTGNSPAISRLRCELNEAARSNARVLITGESGTGKEVAARFIHAGSRRALQPMVAVNCAGLAETLLESELFGHQRGSFTGAMRDKPGLLERAHLGTVFLDEVGEMSNRMQGLLLRFLETGEIQRIGSDRTDIRVDVRVVAATNRNLSHCVEGGEFRLDLFYRLDVLQLRTPALRERAEDIPDLFVHFLERYRRQYGRPCPAIDDTAMHRLCTYRWPGNVRQLKNVAERLAIKAGETIYVDDLPAELKAATIAPTSAALTGCRFAAADQLLSRMLATDDSFWAVVYGPFMSRDLTRDDVRRVVQKGAAMVRGDVPALVRLFNMPADDGRRFLNFLRKHQCQVELSELLGASVPIVRAADHQHAVAVR